MLLTDTVLIAARRQTGIAPSSPMAPSKKIKERRHPVHTTVNVVPPPMPGSTASTQQARCGDNGHCLLPRTGSKRKEAADITAWYEVNATVKVGFVLSELVCCCCCVL